MNAIVLSAVFGVVMMFSGIFTSHRRIIRSIAIICLGMLLAANIAEGIGNNYFKFNTHGMLTFDSFGLLFNSIAFASTLLYFFLSGVDMEKVGVNLAEYFALIFFILCGIAIASSFNTLLMLFLGIEIISIPLYILTGTDKRNLKSNEASLKYFLMGAFSTGLMLMGIALLYGVSGTLMIDQIITSTDNINPLTIGGILLLIISMSFKVSAAPFHFWTPDVYDGAPTVFTSFMATVVKAAVFIAFIRLFGSSFMKLQAEWQLMIAIITAVTLFIGNITAVFQQSVKRMLAYSSIAQAGFMLLALLAMNDLSKEGLILYAAAYSLATIGVFAILAKMKDYTFEGFNGFAKSEPVLAAANAVFLLSLAGIPLTAGFFAKYWMLAAALKTGKFLWLVIFAILCAAVSVYYYFRVIQAMYFREGPAATEPLTTNRSFKGWLVLLAAIIIFLGIFPQWLLDKLYFL
jgi:NADH-quinone oxidoreductase subunit N